MTYILFLVYAQLFEIDKSFSVSEFKSKKACEVALKEANAFLNVINKYSRCIEVAEK